MMRRTMRWALLAMLFQAWQPLLAYGFTSRPASFSGPVALTVSGQAQSFLALAPVQDTRRYHYLYKGTGSLDEVWVEPEGRTLLAKAWQALPRGDAGFLLTWELLSSFKSSRVPVQGLEPGLTQAQALAQAVSLGAKALIWVELRSLAFKVSGNDLIGTSVSGTRYTPASQMTVQLLDASSGKPLFEETIEASMDYISRIALGDEPKNTFPLFFDAFLPVMGRSVAAHKAFKPYALNMESEPTPQALAQPTPESVEANQLTRTAEGLVVTPTPGPSVAPTAAPVSTPDSGAWTCPKCGKTMLHGWKICPYDGTPRPRGGN
jgi:hypothetical protein